MKLNYLRMFLWAVLCKISFSKLFVLTTGIQNISDGACSPCHSSCKKCFGLDFNQCTACYSGAYLEESTCESNLTIRFEM